MSSKPNRLNHSLQFHHPIGQFHPLTFSRPHISPRSFWIAVAEAAVMFLGRPLFAEVLSLFSMFCFPLIGDLIIALLEIQ